MESNDSPEIPDRGETSDIPGLPSKGKEDKHKHGVGFLVHKNIVNTVMECHPVSSRLITIHLRAVPFNIILVQAYAPMSDYNDNKTGEF